MNQQIFHNPDIENRVYRRKDAVRRLLQMHFEAGVGHLGGNLSALDILLTIYHDILKDGDRFILSKGHAAGALYVTLWTLGRITDGELSQFHRDKTLLSGHPPPRGIPEIPFATGSLGHGLGLSCGLALALRLREQAGRVFCLTSDGEWNEGSTWESLIFACQQNLSNLVVILDQNGLQGFGTTQEVADLSPLADKFKAFHLKTLEVDGHDPLALTQAINATDHPGPRIVIAKTIKGKGVSFMENQIAWHYLPMSPEQYRLALMELGVP